MAPSKALSAKPPQSATPVQISTIPPTANTAKPQTEAPIKIIQPETTLAVPTSIPAIDDDFLGDLITEISLYSDLDEGEQLRVGG